MYVLMCAKMNDIVSFAQKVKDQELRPPGLQPNTGDASLVCDGYLTVRQFQAESELEGESIYTSCNACMTMMSTSFN